MIQGHSTRGGVIFFRTTRQGTPSSRKAFSHFPSLRGGVWLCSMNACVRRCVTLGLLQGLPMAISWNGGHSFSVGVGVLSQRCPSPLLHFRSCLALLWSILLTGESVVVESGQRPGPREGSNDPKAMVPIPRALQLLAHRVSYLHHSIRRMRSSW